MVSTILAKKKVLVATGAMASTEYKRFRSLIISDCDNSLAGSQNGKRDKMVRKRPKKHSKKKVSCQADLVKASTAHREGRLADAEKGYMKVLKKHPRWGQVLNALGTVYLDQAQPGKAQKLFERAVALNPPNLSACYNLARLKQQDNDHVNAIPVYQTILKERPDFGEVWNNLGIALRETGKGAEALSCFQKAVKFTPGMAEAWNNLAIAQDDFDMVDESLKSYQKALEIRPDYVSAHFNLGSLFQKLKHFREAEKHYKEVLAIKPKDQAAHFMLQSIGSGTEPFESAPVEHVQRVFDQCAGVFEKILVKDLEYKTPQLLFDLVRPYLKEGMQILDLGCGTGLGAHFYRPFAKLLTGVDVSPKMLERALAKNVYDHLDVLDILQDWTFQVNFDLIYSSDVFVYFGNLDKVVGAISSNLASEGITAFSVEELEDPSRDYELHSGGRYAHSSRYIGNCLEVHGLQLLEKTQSVLRKQSGVEVHGLLVVAKKRENP